LNWSEVIRTRLLIVDDHEIVRIGVRALLSNNSEWEICGEAAGGLEAIEKVLTLSPDIVILDLMMPPMNGVETANRIRQHDPSIGIIFFSLQDMPTTARLVGGDAFVSKASLAQDLPRAIRLVDRRPRAKRPPSERLPHQAEPYAQSKFREGA
jgi:DNA-binding NarL/FixJ family response regulator